MKWKILSTGLDNKALGEVVLEPVDKTYAEALREKEVREEGYKVGYDRGYYEAMNDARAMRMAGGYCHCMTRSCPCLFKTHS
jgi:hypothetical protein